jgi:hypothetical protein
MAGSGKYNEFGQWVASNMGTWGTASTSKWGNAWKAVKDYYGNISMTLTSTDDYLDVDAYLNNGTVQPPSMVMWRHAPRPASTGTKSIRRSTMPLPAAPVARRPLPPTPTAI